MSLSKTYQKLLKERFVLVQCVQTGILMGTGDILAQEVVEKRGWEKYQARRTLEFGFLGCFLVGPAVAAWFKLLAKTFGHEKRHFTALKKMACDQLIFAPGFLVVFMTSLGLLHGRNFKQIKRDFEKGYLDIVITNWTVWPAIQMVNFYFVPLGYQVLLVQSLAIFWNTYLSWKTQNSD